MGQGESEREGEGWARVTVGVGVMVMVRVRVRARVRVMVLDEDLLVRAPPEAQRSVARAREDTVAAPREDQPTHLRVVPWQREYLLEAVPVPELDELVLSRAEEVVRVAHLARARAGAGARARARVRLVAGVAHRD